MTRLSSGLAGGDAAHEVVGIEVGSRIQRPDLAARSHRNHRPADPGRPDAVDEALQIQIQSRNDRFTRSGLQGGRAGALSNQAPSRVHFDIADTLDAPERVVILPLQSRLADDGPQHRTGIAVRAEIRFGDL